ncbi:MAG: hypothetical protein A2289_04965 [Deltaproteobacteria bacterium RIFOXYA12_FULL_58_15]|nr:MAG: hypothetical protein A2289_04965 [Deltaproteobacteria bacterium RIFOXYA12_FULL_58_15]OGR12803.1 MAG: hypothetical protein A2341_24595 [Deltaproteobacteria bacterium RIFOXYB12_FULL_58_9]
MSSQAARESDEAKDGRESAQGSRAGRGGFHPFRALRRRYRRFWARAPRQLRFTTEGKIVVGIALAVGAAAINTGNNLLMLGWGLILSAILISGVLSEATLRPLRLRARLPREPRVGEVTAIGLTIDNTAAILPAFGVEAAARIRDGSTIHLALAHYQLRLEPKNTTHVEARFVPVRRGWHRISRLIARTSYPFGFFTKSRRFANERHLEFWAYPAAVDVEQLASFLFNHLGDESANNRGLGDDFFSLRPFQTGDDPRTIHWRRSAKSGRWWVRETEAQTGRELVLELPIPSNLPHEIIEHGIATLGSLSELLLSRDMRVGIRAPGVAILPGTGLRQRKLILLALARLDPVDAMPELSISRATARVCLALRGGLAGANADIVLQVGELP